MATEGHNWLKKEHGDGWSAQLLTRLPYDRELLIELAQEREEVVLNALMDLASSGKAPRRQGAGWSAFTDAVLRAHLWAFEGIDYLTGEPTDEIGKAHRDVVDKVRLAALKLYAEWRAEAYPKDDALENSPETGDEPSETNAKG